MADKNINKKTVPLSSRAAALELLMRVEMDGSYSNLLVGSELDAVGLKGADAALMTALFYSVLQNMICLDFMISRFSNRPAAKMQPVVRQILRLGACQLIYFDRVPTSAAVNESVKLAKAKAGYAAGFVNAVLRKISASLENLPYPDRERDRRRFLHIYYSCPMWLIDKWTADFGADITQKILDGFAERTPSILRVNTLKTTAAELINILAGESIEAFPSKICDDAIVTNRLPELGKSAAFKAGLFNVQGAASQLCCKAAGAMPGDHVIDMCAAPGGKSFTLAFMMQNRGEILSLDLYGARLGLISEGAKRLGIDIIKTRQNDGSVHNDELGEADIVLCDAPCSGLGVIGRKPEIRYKNPKIFDELPDLQYAILCEASTHVATGGRLIYSTCTLNRRENDDVAARFISEHNNFIAVTPHNLLPDDAFFTQSGEGVTIFPDKCGTDGFFIAVFKRQK